MEINLCIACISTYDEPDPEYVKDQIRADAISVIRMYLHFSRIRICWVSIQH